MHCTVNIFGSKAAIKNENVIYGCKKFFTQLVLAKQNVALVTYMPLRNLASDVSGTRKSGYRVSEVNFFSTFR